MSIRPRHDESEETMAAVIRLLDAATWHAYDKADAEGCTSPWHMIGWGLRITTVQAWNLLPEHVDVSGDAPLETEPLPLIRAAIDLAATLPIQHRPAGLSAMLATLQDLAHEVAHHDQA